MTLTSAPVRPAGLAPGSPPRSTSWTYAPTASKRGSPGVR